MKLSSLTLRTFTWLHSWLGLLSGIALFIAFYAGAITVFHHELPLWQGAQHKIPSLGQTQQLLDTVLEHHPEARYHVGMTFPGQETAQPLVYWLNEQGTWQYAWIGQIEGKDQPPHSALAQLINELHYSLGLPVAGKYLMGIISLLYGITLLSGLIIYFPRLSQDVFALRTGNNIKQFWRDRHNLMGIFSFPFHMLFAITGAWLCLFAWQVAILNPLLFKGQLPDVLPATMDTAPVREPVNILVNSSASLQLWQQRAIKTAAEQGITGFEPVYLKLAHVGDIHAVVEITGKVPRTLAPLGAIAMDAATGEILAMQLPGQRDANHATLSGIYALHFAEYGNSLISILYFLLGICGSFLFYSGNLLWIESRRKRRQIQQGRAQIIMAKLTIGLCIGVCAAISSAFVASQLFEYFWPQYAEKGIRISCFLLWSSCVLWALIRSPAQGARELLGLAALLTLLSPLAHGFLTDRWLWHSALTGQWSLFYIDTTALLMACGFYILAKASQQRARLGNPHSVWSNSQN